MARVIDGDAVKRRTWDIAEAWKDQGRNYEALLLESVIEQIVDTQPTLNPPNEPMLERVVREYLEICGNDCAGDPSVGIPECPFYQYADVLDNGALIQPKCELAAYRRPPEGEEDT